MTPAAARPAASVLLVRPSRRAGLEVYMIHGILDRVQAVGVEVRREPAVGSP